MTRSVLLIAAVVLASGGCSERDQPAVKRDSERPRRVIEPPSRGVRALPPHAIRPDGVGPYKLGAPAAEILDQLPSGPRIRQFAIPGIVNRDMLRGEDDAILIGAEPQGKAMFVAVVRGEIARTEAGIQVGSTREQLAVALGPPLEEAERARDPRLVVPTKPDNAHVVLDGDRISAIVLTPAVERMKDPAPPQDSRDAKYAKDAKDPKDPKDPKDHKEHKEHKDHKEHCTRPTGDRTQQTVGACLTAAGELVRIGAEDISVLVRDSDKIMSTARVPGIVFAAPLRVPGEGRDDIVAVVKTDSAQEATWSLIVFRMIDGKLLRLVEPSLLYQVTAAHARWVGSELRDLDLLLELTARPDAIEASGFLTTRVGAQIRDIVVISTSSVPRRRSKAAPVEPPGPGAPPGAAGGTAAGARPTR